MKISKWLQTEIHYSSNWVNALIVGLILGLVLSGSMILLQPFDTYDFKAPHKNLMLLGYALGIVLPTVLLYPVEKWLYKKQAERWLLWNELSILFVGCWLMMTASYFYNTIIVNGFRPSFINWWDFILSFGLPFCIFLSPGWYFLRKLMSRQRSQQEVMPPRPLTIVSQNKGERLELLPGDFIYAQAQHNYMELYHKAPDNMIQKVMLRMTLAQLQEQIPGAVQIHRSFLLNPEHALDFSGNARKRLLQVNYLSDPLPVSAKYYERVKNQLSNSAQ